MVLGKKTHKKHPQNNKKTKNAAKKTHTQNKKTKNCGDKGLTHARTKRRLPSQLRGLRRATTAIKDGKKEGESHRGEEREHEEEGKKKSRTEDEGRGPLVWGAVCKIIHKFILYL